MFAGVTLQRELFRYGALNAARKQEHAHEIINRLIDVPKQEYSDQEPGQSKAVAAQPVEIPLRSFFTHEQHDHRAAVQRREGQKIERAE